MTYKAKKIPLFSLQTSPKAHAAFVISEFEYNPPTYGGNPIEEGMEEQRFIFGQENPEKEWILTSWDVWVKNPFYLGKPGRHPEDDDGRYEMEEPVKEYLPDPPAEIVLTFEDDIPF